MLLRRLLRIPTPPSWEKSCHAITFAHVLRCSLPYIVQVPSHRHVPKCFFVSALLGVSIIYTEMLARLLSFVPSYPAVIAKLCQQCLSRCSVCPYPVLIPLCGFLQPPGGPLHTMLTGFLEGRVSPGDRYSPRIYQIIHLF